MGFRGGGVKLTPPQHILVFKYPSRDRVKRDFVDRKLHYLYKMPFEFTLTVPLNVVFDLWATYIICEQSL